MNYTILLTMTIDNRLCYHPKNSNDSYMRDIDIRMKCYVKSISLWCKTSYKIVIIENSMHDRINDIIKIIENNKNSESLDLSNNKKINLIYDNIELISYNENNSSSLYGKGYGERDSIKYAINNSKLIDNNFIIKITGRYYIWNLYIIDKFLKENINVACKYMSKKVI